jgi:hypothetical protein
MDMPFKTGSWTTKQEAGQVNKKIQWVKGSSLSNQ